MAFLYWIHLPEHTDIFKEGYVGITTRTVKQRYVSHKIASKTPSKHHLPIYRAINKYGDNILVSTVVEGPEDYILNLEITLRPKEGIGWNCAMGGQATGKGRTHSREEILKRARSNTGKTRSKQARMNMSSGTKGITKTASHRDKIRIANIGKKTSLETRNKIADANRGPTRMTMEGRAALSASKKALHPWQRSKSNPEVWLSADVIYCHYPDKGRKELSECTGFSYSSLFTIYNKLKSGWNPSEDSAWLQFKNEKENV